MSKIFSARVNALDGSPFDLKALRRHPVLFVNVASRCGFTPQYEGLEALWKRYRSNGLTIIGVPCNDFGAQEPGTPEEIGAFCSTRYSVTFPLLEKQSVKGPNQSELYAALTEQEAAPEWNFHKFLVGRNGTVVGSFASKVDPLSKELTDAIDDALSG